MTNRITQSMLESSADYINRITNSPREYSDKTSPTFKSLNGHYMIDYAYGGCKLVRVSGESGGISSITSGYVSKRELYNQMQAFIRGVEAVHA